MNSNKRGFTLAVIIIMTTAILTILAAVFHSVTQVYIYSQEEYYNKLAQEAGEAGTAMANACLDQYGRVQTWGSASGGVGPLIPSSDCKGASNAFSQNQYVTQAGKLRTKYSVSNLEYLDDYHAEVVATGTTEIIDSSGAVSKTYTVLVKKSITWPADLVATRSVSGTYRTCSILSNSVWCWGQNRYGQLGNGKAIGSGSPEDSDNTVDSNIPVKVKATWGTGASEKVTDMFAAQFHSCALVSGKVYCWGYDQFGQLGDGRSGSRAYSSVPVLVQGALAGKTVTAIGGSGNTSCAIANGKIYCWGGNDKGVVGVGYNATAITTPQLVATGGTNGLSRSYVATKLATSGTRSYNMCAIADGLAYCWGDNNAAQIGQGYAGGPIYQPTKIPGLTNVTDISQDGFHRYSGDTSRPTHVCAISSGYVYCWGGSYYGQSGSGTQHNYTSGSQTWAGIYSPNRIVMPSEVSTQTVRRIGVGITHSCMLTSGNKVYCWGANWLGQLGVGYRTGNKNAPQAVLVSDGGIPADQTVLDIGSGANRACAVVSNGRSYCWGYNASGQIGDGTYVDRFAPTESLFLRPSQNRFIY